MVNTSQHPQRAGSHEKWSSLRRTCSSGKVMPNTSPFLPYTWPTRPLTRGGYRNSVVTLPLHLNLLVCRKLMCNIRQRTLTEHLPRPDKQLPFGNNSAWNMDHECHKSLLLANRVYLHDHIFLCIWQVVLWSNKRALKPSFNEHDRNWWDQ